MSTLVERTLVAIFIFCSAGCVFLLLTQRSDSSILKMETKLENDIAALEMDPQYFFPRAQVDYPEINQKIGEKKLLWQELIPPPVTIVAPPPPPNMTVLLKGVIPNKRKQMGTGDSLKIHIITPASPRGSWMRVGDTYRKMTIVAITKEHVEFMLVDKKKEYTHKVKRR